MDSFKFYWFRENTYPRKTLNSSLQGINTREYFWEKKYPEFPNNECEWYALTIEWYMNECEWYALTCENKYLRKSKKLGFYDNWYLRNGLSFSSWK